MKRFILLEKRKVMNGRKKGVNGVRNKAALFFCEK
jgi:hypothetical protein